MKVQSAVNPSKFYIRKIELGEAYIKLRNNVVEQLDEDENIIFNYDEVEIKISDRANLEAYIKDNFTQLFEMGKLEESKIVEPTDENKIKALESTLMDLSNIQASTELALMELTMMIGGK